MKTGTYDLVELKLRLPMLELLQRDGVPMRKSGSGWVGRCPFHQEKTGSFHVGSKRPDRARCFGCGWSGSVVDYWKQSRGLDFAESMAQLASLVGLAPKMDGVGFQHAVKLRKSPVDAETRVKPNLPRMRALTDEEMATLASLRKLSMEGIRLAARLKRVGWAMWPQTQRCVHHGWSCFMKGDGCEGSGEFRTNKWSTPCWVVTDGSRNVAQFRRLDGGVFFDKEGLRMMTQGSPTWPIGAAEMDVERRRDRVLVCEGGADMLAAFHFIAGLGLWHAVAVVCMLGAGNRIGGDALPFFRGRLVRVLADNDPIKEQVMRRPDGSERVRRTRPGLDAALRWRLQLQDAGAAAVDVFDLEGLVRCDGEPVKDLNDMALCSAATMAEEGLTGAFTDWNF